MQLVKVKFEVLKIQGTKKYPAKKPYGLYAGLNANIIWAGPNGEATDETTIHPKTGIAFPQLKQARYQKGFVFYADAVVVDDEPLSPIVEINGLKFTVDRSRIL